MSSNADYLFTRNNRYYFVRRPPRELREFDSRPLIRVALKTDSRSIALTKAKALNAEIEGYWKKLVAAGEKHADKAFHQATEFSRQLGFTYLPHASLVQGRPTSELNSRLVAIEQSGFNQRHVEALWGGVVQPEVTLDETMHIFFSITKDRIVGKTQDQIRRWRNPRKRVMRTFTAIVGNKKYHELTRDDTLAFRDYWIEKVEEEGCTPETANKEIIHMKNMIETVADYKKIKLDTRHLFGKLLLKEDKEQKRLPFETDYIVNTLLSEETLSQLNGDAKYFLMAMAETGARDGEIVNLNKDSIILNHPIPHIDIKKGKTPYSKRKIPLVGYALEAFKARPNGFTTKNDNPHLIPVYLNKVLREKGLFPTEMHSLYSLRHSFQDRLTNAGIKERVDAQLMGHKFDSREAYGNGATLETRLQAMQQIALKK